MSFLLKLLKLDIFAKGFDLLYVFLLGSINLIGLSILKNKLLSLELTALEVVILKDKSLLLETGSLFLILVLNLLAIDFSLIKFNSDFLLLLLKIFNLKSGVSFSIIVVSLLVSKTLFLVFVEL